jgi:hypothetical protein
MTFRKGTLLSLHGSFGSGLALLTVNEVVPHGATRSVTIPCDAGPTSRALRSAFGDEVAGQEVLFSVDALGILDGFLPLRDAAPGATRCERVQPWKLGVSPKKTTPDDKVAGPKGKSKGERKR